MRKSSFEVKCSSCQNILSVQSYKLKNQKQHFCNRKCYMDFRRGQDLGGYIQTICYECNSSFTKPRYLYKKTTNHFCSNDCYSFFRAREGNTNITGPTKIELYFESLLKEIQVEYLMYHLIKDPKYGKCYYDFYIPSLNLLIEIDGDYWHSNPLKYPILNSQQEKCKLRDIEKNEVAKNNKLPLIRIWESDLNLLNSSTLKQLLF